MNLTPRRLTAALAAALLGAAALAGCASSNDTAAENDTAVEETQAVDTGVDAGADAGDDAQADTSGGLAGDWSVTVDGTAVDMPDAVATCAEHDGTLAISIAAPSADAQQAIGATLKVGEPLTVQTVALVDADGSALAYAEGADTGSATATQDGTVYTVSGEAMATDLDNPTSVTTKSFELVVDCG